MSRNPKRCKQDGMRIVHPAKMPGTHNWTTEATNRMEWRNIIGAVGTRL
jgi:hypothetical protein